MDLVAKVGESPAAALDLMRYQSTLTVAEAVQGVQLSTLKRQNQASAETAVVFLLSNLQSNLNITQKMNGLQLAQAAIDILANWPFLKIEELALVLKDARLGKYGKSFNRLDIQVIGEWIDAYEHSEEKAKVFEQRAAEFKAKELAPAELTPEQEQQRDYWLNKIAENIKKQPAPKTNRRQVVNPVREGLEALDTPTLEAYIQTYGQYDEATASLTIAREILASRQKGAAA